MSVLGVFFFLLKAVFAQGCFWLKAVFGSRLFLAQGCS
jgi:hypothetical protein